MADCEGAELRLLATKPDGPVGRRLRELGFRVDLLEEPAPVDRYIVSPRLATRTRPAAPVQWSHPSGSPSQGAFVTGIVTGKGFDR